MSSKAAQSVAASISGGAGSPAKTGKTYHKLASSKAISSNRPKCIGYSSSHFLYKLALRTSTGNSRLAHSPQESLQARGRKVAHDRR
jgi:hypothetical protein